MGDKPLVRSYNVGCGDCFYVRIPNDDDGFHILIDCGTKESANTGVIQRAIKHLEDEVLPDANGGKKRLDLIVVSHRHEDHIKGFDPDLFENITIGNIWLTAAMNKDHPQAQNTQALHELAREEMQALDTLGAALSPELESVVAHYRISNEAATTALTETLPAANDIEPTYVFAGNTSDDLGIQIKDAKLVVLAPEHDIDGFYLGKRAEETLRGFAAAKSELGPQPDQGNIAAPTNITAAEFRALQSRVLSNSLAFAVDDSRIQNNVSTVLLIEWKGRRLLFVGDAEWEHGFEQGKRNGSWNVMWHERKAQLDALLDFLKVGHHGSHNATPWNRDAGPDDELNQILDAILPVPPSGQEPTAQCIISTKRKQYPTVPDAELLTELGRRVRNTKVYLTEFQEADSSFEPEQGIFNYSNLKDYSTEPTPREVGDVGFLDRPQPHRTDMESVGKGEKEMVEIVEFVDAEIAPGNN